jgi:dynein heavy chain
MKFKEKISVYDKDNITDKTIKAIEKYTKMDNFFPDYITKISEAAGALCTWVRSIEEYAKALKIVKPKKQRLEAAEEKLRRSQEALDKLEAEF